MLAAPAVPLHSVLCTDFQSLGGLPRGAGLGWDWPTFCLPGGVCTVLKTLQCVLSQTAGSGGNAGAQGDVLTPQGGGCWKLLHPCRVRGEHSVSGAGMGRRGSGARGCRGHPRGQSSVWSLPV